MDLQSVFSTKNWDPYKSLEFSTVSLLFYGADIFAKQNRASESKKSNYHLRLWGYFDRYLKWSKIEHAALSWGSKKQKNIGFHKILAQKKFVLQIFWVKKILDSKTFGIKKKMWSKTYVEINLLVQKTLSPKNVGPNWVTIRFVVAEIFHYTKTGTHVEGTNVAGQKRLCPKNHFFIW